VADDVAFLQYKQAQNQAKQQEMKKATRRQRLIDQLAPSEVDSRETKTSSRSRRTRSSSDIFEEDRLPATSKMQGIHSSDFYGTGKTTQSNAAASHGTRSSARLSDKDHKPFQTFRERSPSPERWTALHPNWDKNFWYRSIVHPQQGKNQATVELQDIERLDEGEFLNDSLIGFYLRLLETRLQDDRPELAKRVYFFNTFFYTRLTSSGTKGKGINYAAVERWTSKVKLLDYDYIIVPVNENTHWYVAIICNAPKLLPRTSEDVELSQSQDISTKSEGHKIPGGEIKSTRSSPSSAKHSPTTTPDPEVNAQIESMSLEDKPTAKEETDRPQNKPEDDPKGGLNNKMELDEEDDSWPEANEDSTLKQTLVVGVSDTDHRGARADKAKEAEPAATTITSDIPTATTPKSALVKKSKRKSTPGPRKYSINEPRIITFDSFDTGHSTTCTNLKQYLVAEAKAKLNIDIDPPAQIGMTAKNIPKQNNFCDCGLFLLGYVETFLKKPDEFIHGILQNQVDVELKWPEAPEMRNNIRNIIFKLQKDRMTEPEKLRYENELAERAEKEKAEKAKAEKAKAEKEGAEKALLTALEHLLITLFLRRPRKPPRSSRDPMWTASRKQNSPRPLKLTRMSLLLRTTVQSHLSQLKLGMARSQNCFQVRQKGFFHIGLEAKLVADANPPSSRPQTQTLESKKCSKRWSLAVILEHELFSQTCRILIPSSLSKHETKTFRTCKQSRQIQIALKFRTLLRKRNTNKSLQLPFQEPESVIPTVSSCLQVRKLVSILPVQF
jgi:sentrin-specific protease 7